MSIIPSVLGQRTSIFDPFNLDIWDPSEDFPIPLTEILSTSHSNLANEASAFANTRIDWKETPEAHIIKADLLGLSKEVHVQVEEGNILQIRGERKKEKEEKNEKWHRVERSIGKFVRRFLLPDNAKVDEMNATMENGVLTITLPKEEVKKPDVKSVEVSG